MSELKYVTQDTFDTDVIHSVEPVLVDVTAVWCAPCRMLEPIVKEVAETWQDKMKVVKLDADQNPGLMTQYGILGIPTLMFFKDGKLQERMTGFQSRDRLVAKISPHL